MILNCPRCGKPFNGSRICQNCGYQFNDTDIRAFFQDQKRKSNNNTGLIIFIVIAILLLFIVGIGFAVFVPAFVGYKAKSDEARRRQEYSQSQNSSVYKENDEEHDKDENVSDPSLTSCECEIYDCGEYQVGKDIEPGKYRLEKTDIKKTLNYKIYSSIDTVPPTIRQKASFEYGSPEVSISEGEYLSVMFGKPVKID